MKKSQSGYVGVIILVLLGFMFFVALLFISFKGSNEVVSGIAYNTKNDKLFTGNSTFSVRASEATYTNESNQSSYCLPPNSPYKELVNRAARDKRVKIEVEAKKYFAIQAPWTCKNNVVVREVKQ